MPASDSRFRSFAERYVIERARNWPADGKERERAYDAMLDARGIYDQIALVDTTMADMGYAGQPVQQQPVTLTRATQRISSAQHPAAPAPQGRPYSIAPEDVHLNLSTKQHSWWRDLFR